MLTAADRERFRSEGYLLVRDLVPADAIAAMASDVDRWIDESRGHVANYGEMARGKLRFDLEAGHSAERPRLRRVANPADIAEAYRRVLWEGPVVAGVAALIGPDVKFHHCKLNLKLPGMETYVDWHQDHPFDPHTNDDMLAVLVMIDDAIEENGCLQVVPGSHRERHTHYDGDTFTGAIAPAAAAELARRAVPLPGRAGDAVIIDTWMVHGSAANRTDRPRRLLICDYSAADAVPLTPMSVPTVHTGRIVHGQATRIARFRTGTVELPPVYQEDSFFSVQGQKAAAA